MDRSLTLSQFKKINQKSAEVSLLAKKLNDILFKKKIVDLDAEDVRLLIGQALFLDVTIPLALDILTSDPMAEGDFYPGDLLKNTLEIDASYWGLHDEEKNRLKHILAEHRQYILDHSLSNAIRLQLKELMEVF